MTTKTILETIRYKLTHSNKLFLNKWILDIILWLSQSSYTIADLVRVGYIDVIKNNTFYLNKLYPRTSNPEAIVGLYCKWQEYMIGGIGIYNNYGFTTQQAQKTVVYTTTMSGSKTIAGQRFLFYKKRPSFFYGKIRKTTQWIDYYVMSRERVIIQLVLDHDGIIEYPKTILEQVQNHQISLSLLNSRSQTHLTSRQKTILNHLLWITTHD